MDDDSDQRQKDLSISFAASSMINGSEMISEEAYRANLKRIQEVKEMVQRLEMNNESAHKNYLVDQLEKRAKEGREAEIMLTQLRNQPGLPETVQSTNNAPGDKSEVILPTTATLVEVPESQPSSYSSLPTTSYPQPVQQGLAPKYLWSLPAETHQGQSYSPNIFRYYIPPSTTRQPPQHNAAPRSQAPISGQVGWNVPPQSRVYNPLAHQPTQTQQSPQIWSSYSHPTIALPIVDTVPGYHTSASGWTRTVPASSAPSTSTTDPDPSFRAQSIMSHPPVTAHNQSQNLPSFVHIPQVPVPLNGVSASSAKIPSGQPLSTQPLSTAVSKPVAISRPQLVHKPLPPPPYPQQQQLPYQPQQFPQRSLPLQPQHHLQPPPQPQHQPQRSQELPSQQPLQQPPAHLPAPPRSADLVSSTDAPRRQSKPSQPLQRTAVREQASQRGVQHPVDQTTFIKLFQTAAQGGISNLKHFFLKAKVAGISDEWFSVAIRSLPRDVRQSVMTQINQPGTTLDGPLPANVPQPSSTILTPNVPMASARPSPTATPVQSTPTTEQAAKASTSSEGRIALSVPAEMSGQYAAHLQYYAEQATKSALATQMAYTSTTPARDVPRAQVDVRTPKDANKSTLARDILRSLGKAVPKPSQEVGSKPPDRASNQEDDQLPDVNVPPSVSYMTPPKLPIAPLFPSAKSNVQAGLHPVATPTLSTTRSVSKEEEGHRQAAVDGSIMIDLTLDDSDESVDGKGPEPTFPIQTSTGAATSSQPVSPTNTTNHTPLLENLTLEEPRIEVVADGDNADVRMYSPPLSLTAEEHTESELLYPPLGSAVPVPSSFKPMPREVSEHSLGGQLPLFLPSPPVSPAPTEPPETDFEVTNDEGKSFFKRRSVDVDEVETDIELLTPPARKRRKRQVYVLIPPAPFYVRKAIKKMKGRAVEKDINSDLDGAGEDEEFQYSHLEQLLIEESKSQLLERRCRWLNCGAVLNCAANLLAHLKNHASEESLQVPFLCRWAGCQRRFDMEQERDAHLERHTIRPLPCPFAGCDEQFNRPVEVMQHEVQHQKAEREEHLMRKATYHPIVPGIPARLGPPPHRLPSHRVIARRVVKCQISADRHATMGPWILWNIFSPVDLNTRKQNASMRGRSTRQTVDYDIDSSNPRRDDYDFLLALSSYPAKNPQPDDIDSTLITMSAARGLTLWGSRSAVNSAAATACTPDECTDVDVAVLTSAAEGRSDVDEVAATARENSRPEERQSVVTGEEDTVERMLVL